MTTASSTINPLHFEDLEPHRFEDLIRQLVYDFRPWSSLEATGRSGSDDGFDARGYESLPIEEVEPDTEEEASKGAFQDRIWLIQCKREQKIGPQKIKKYLDEVLSNNKDSIYGIIFAAASDFPKKTRDEFRAKCRSYKLSECYLWGKAELEDMLFQPKNDNLLFAYFGISLSIRKRSLKTKINSRLTIKRKIVKCLGDINHRSFSSVLLRDPSENRYPYKKDVPDFDKHPTWKVYYFIGHRYNGLEFLTRKFFAYIDDDGIHWDYIVQFDESRPPKRGYGPNNVTKDQEKRNKAHRLWLDITEKNRAWLEVSRVVLYDNIIAVDETGDNMYHDMPHIYVPFKGLDGPFETYYFASVNSCQSFGGRSIEPEDENRIKFFPTDF